MNFRTFAISAFVTIHVLFVVGFALMLATVSGSGSVAADAIRRMAVDHTMQLVVAGWIVAVLAFAWMMSRNRQATA